MNNIFKLCNKIINTLFDVAESDNIPDQNCCEFSMRYTIPSGSSTTNTSESWVGTSIAGAKSSRGTCGGQSISQSAAFPSDQKTVPYKLLNVWLSLSQPTSTK